MEDSGFGIRDSGLEIEAAISIYLTPALAAHVCDTSPLPRIPNPESRLLPMRYLICLIGGALLGALVAVTIANILGQRNAYPRALMNVMQHELGRARDLVHANQCASPDADAAAARLASMSKDVEPALLAPGAHDRVFSQYASDLRDAVAAFAAASDCPGRAEAVTKIGHACDACHRDYK
jgi:hypothetical protein